MKPFEVNIENQTEVDVNLESDSQLLNEVVVTALGIERKAKSLTYSTQTISNAELTKAKDPNPMNNLAGKVSGLQINRSSSGAGGSVSIVLRGLKSNRNNQPLYVIDGLPITNTSGSGGEGAFGGNNGGHNPTDKGDILSTLNPDDIQSINVLKGASASALYGSVGQNGAIMITTKKGAIGKTKIDFSVNSTFDKAFYLPKMQYRYGQTPSQNGDAEDSWGNKGNFKNHVDDFYKTGHTLITSVALSGGNEKTQNYFSYSNTTNKGILPTNGFNQNTFTYRQSSNFFNNKLQFDGSMMYSNQDVKNRPTSGLYFSPIAGVYLFPRGLDFDYYKNNYEYLSPTRNLNLQNWFNINADKGLSGTHHSQNPFWVLNKIPNIQTRDNIIAQLSTRYTINEWLSLSLRGTLNKRWDNFERHVHAGTQGVLSGQTSANISTDNGRFMRDSGGSTTKYGDILLIGNKDLSDQIEMNFTLGGSINDEESNSWNIDARKLQVANGFYMSNIFRNDPISSLNEVYFRRQIQSVFASTNFGFNEYFYIDLTARNDWSSTLANTPSAKKGYFYYSAGASTLLNEFINMPKWVNYSKFRVTYAEVGNDVTPYATMIPQGTVNSGLIVPNNSGIFNNAELKPERSKSWETGLEARLFNNRMNLDIALYRTNTTNQYFSFKGPVGLLNTTLFLNAGNVQNQGIEVAIGYDVINSPNLKWNTGLNYTVNKNKIIKLHPNLDKKYPIGNFNVLREGGTFGDIWGRTFLRDKNGVMIVNEDGRPVAGEEDYLGSTIPNALIGWNNSFDYKGFNLGFTVDGRFGGKVISITQGYLNSFGLSEESAAARDKGYIDIYGTTLDGKIIEKANPQEYYQGIGNRDGIIEGLLYSATNIRLRELSLSYKFKINSKFINSANVGLVGRNLFFFKNDAPYDPELNTSTGVVGQGFDSFALPSTRSFGLNLKFSF